MNNFLIQFLVDAVKRFFSKTPWFFVVLQILSAVAFFIVSIPETLVYLCTQKIACITLPISIETFYAQVVKIAAIVITFTSQFAVKTPTLASKNIKE